MGGALDFIFTGIGDDWPLITYLVAQDEYKTIYNGHIQKFLDDVYTTANVNAKFADAHSMIEQYVVGSEGEESGYTFVNSSSYSSALSTLQSHTSSRISAANSYLD
jgi:hypothetical protein